MYITHTDTQLDSITYWWGIDTISPCNVFLLLNIISSSEDFLASHHTSSRAFSCSNRTCVWDFLWAFYNSPVTLVP